MHAQTHTAYSERADAPRSPVRESIIDQGGTTGGARDDLLQNLLRERARACCLVVAPNGTGEALSSPFAVCVFSLTIPP